MVFFPKQNKAYMSELDLFLCRYDLRHPRDSASQKAEIIKYDRIDELRDHPQQQPKDQSDL